MIRIQGINRLQDFYSRVNRGSRRTIRKAAEELRQTNIIRNDEPSRNADINQGIPSYLWNRVFLKALKSGAWIKTNYKATVTNVHRPLHRRSLIKIQMYLTIFYKEKKRRKNLTLAIQLVFPGLEKITSVSLSRISPESMTQATSSK